MGDRGYLTRQEWKEGAARFPEHRADDRPKEPVRPLETGSVLGQEAPE